MRPCFLSSPLQRQMPVPESHRVAHGEITFPRGNGQETERPSTGFLAAFADSSLRPPVAAQPQYLYAPAPTRKSPTRTTYELLSCIRLSAGLLNL